MNDSLEDPYQCIGYCQVDDAGYCLGCGRPTRGVTTAFSSVSVGVRDGVPSSAGASTDNGGMTDSLSQ